MYFFDTETCGLHGMAVTIQYAKDDGEIIIHEVWKEPARNTLDLIEKFCADGVIGFNLAFDWFHLCKLYTTLRLLPDSGVEPVDNIDLIAQLEKEGRDGPCVKPSKIQDLMLHARKGPYQSTMERDDIRIRKVPAQLGEALANELEKRVYLRPIFFANRRDKYARKWTVRPHKDRASGKILEDFVDVVLAFAPSGALKMLAIDALGVDPSKTLLFSDAGVDTKFRPVEFGFAPFALAGVMRKNDAGIRIVDPTRPGYWRGTWPAQIEQHIRHWRYYSIAREYAKKDVEYTRNLYRKFGEPAFNDDDSVLAAQVAACRWRGYSINVDKIKKLREVSISQSKSAPRAPAQVRIYLEEVMSETERLVLASSTKKTILESIAEWGIEEEEDEALLESVSAWKEHEAAKRAKEVLNARKAEKEVEIYDKLLMAGRFHASFKVIGALSTRMSGSDDLNPQGINRREDVRDAFTLAFDGENLDGGDFEAFEVSLADSVYPDRKLHADLLAGRSVHAIFGTYIFHPLTYEEVNATKGTADDKYTKSKSGFFATLYFGNEHTLMTKLGVSEENAKRGFEKFMADYQDLGKERKKVVDAFCSMRQPGGIGTAIEWHDPPDYVESLFGFRRYFTLENSICRALFDLAQHPPEAWKAIKIKVVRRDRVQSLSGATQSALYGAAFGLQGANMRAAGNHKIQSSGAQITKRVQCAIWELQPCGVAAWVVRPLNIHDEIESPCSPDVSEKQKAVVEDTVAGLKAVVPLLSIKWKQNLESWAGK